VTALRADWAPRRLAAHGLRCASAQREPEAGSECSSGQGAFA
jgi:hypothetical protein